MAAGAIIDAAIKGRRLLYAGAERGQHGNWAEVVWEAADTLVTQR